jgi:MFS family permease
MTTVDTAVDTSRTIRIRWVFVTFLVIGGVVNYLDRTNLSIANTTIADEFDLTATQMGLLLAAFSWPYALANLPAGYLVDRFGPKRMYAWAAGLWSAVSMLSATASTFGLLYAARVALGITESPFFTASLKVNERWFAKEERALPVSVVNTGSQIANAIAPPLLTFLLIALGWRGMFLVVGALGLVIVVVWLKLYRDPTVSEQRLIKGDEAEPRVVASTEPERAAGVWTDEHGDSCARNEPRDLRAQEGRRRVQARERRAERGHVTVRWHTLFRQRNTWFMMLGAFGIFYTVWVYLTWLPSYLQTARGFSLAKSGWLASLPFLCGIVGVLFGGWLSGRLIRRGVRTVTARKIPIVGGATLAAAAVLPVAYVHSTPLAITLLSVGYFASQVPIGCLWTLASDIADSSQVASLGAIQNFGGFIGAAVAPVLTGVILDRTGGNYTLVFLVGGVLLLVGAVSYLFFVKDRKP